MPSRSSFFVKAFNNFLEILQVALNNNKLVAGKFFALRERIEVLLLWLVG